MGNQGARFPQPEAHLAEQPLTLPNSQMDPVKLFQMVRQQLAVPEVLPIAKLRRLASEVSIDSFPLNFCEPPWAAAPFALLQACKAALLEPLGPAFNSSRILAQKIGNVVTAQSLGKQQDSVQPVIITGLLGSENLLLHGNLHDLNIRNLQFAHSLALPAHNMAGRRSINQQNYAALFMSFCIACISHQISS